MEEWGRMRTTGWEDLEKDHKGGGRWIILLAAVCVLLLVAACILGHRVGQLRDANIALTEEAGRLSAEIGRLENEIDDLQQELEKAEEQRKAAEEKLRAALEQNEKDSKTLTVREWLEMQKGQ